jgi:hypothetical protein
MRGATGLTCLLLILSVAHAGGPDETPPIVSATAGVITSLTVTQLSSPIEPNLSAAAQRVSGIAEQNGDHDFLMIDKAVGKIIAFEHGTPTFSGAALTGENLADSIPADAFSKSFSETRGLKYKVTPAGRFTVSSGYDPAYGVTLDVNEIHGKDWNISIHRVWLGAPSEHRDVRLRTQITQDKHITYGCIDVEADTMRQLLRHLPHMARTPVYILPVDESQIARLFPPHDVTRYTPASLPQSTVARAVGKVTP